MYNSIMLWLILSHVMYSNQIWDSKYQSNVSILQVLHINDVRFVGGCSREIQIDYMCNEYHVLCLSDINRLRRTRE